MFAGVQSVLPGHYLKIALRSDGKRAEITEHRYWDFDFPDAGEERDPADEPRLLDEFEQKFRRAVEIRLRADVPVVGYLSGGVDSAYVLAIASLLRGSPVPSFTIQVPGKSFDETEAALVTARHLGSRPTILTSDARVISDTYARLIASADCPVPDTSCAALWCLSQEVHQQGYKVALTGEGSDEAFGGYVWFKVRQMGYWLDQPGGRVSDVINRLIRKIADPQKTMAELKRVDDLTGGHANAQAILYHLVASARDRYFSASLKELIGGHLPYEDVALDQERMRRWSPLNQSLYFGYKVHLAGQLLNYKGDRVAMANSVETRYPYLDEDFISFVSQLAPRWKLRGMRDKYILRHAAARVLPREAAFRAKAMFRAPLAETFLADAPEFVRQLMSPEALARTGYFDAETVGRDYALIASGKAGKVGVFKRLGLSSVVATQLWHHLYLGGGLCELPEHSPTPQVQRPVLPPEAA
jgi:asparagine synthase (glutamine-hydrolysing)